MMKVLARGVTGKHATMVSQGGQINVHGRQLAWCTMKEMACEGEGESVAAGGLRTVVLRCQ